jgi:streptomycin 6-kinase
VLKVAWRHFEADDESAGLREWDGDGAVTLYDAAGVDDVTVALLLEPSVPGTPLCERPEDEQDVVIAALLRRLWREPPSAHRFRPLQQMCDAWADSFARKVSPLDAPTTRRGAELFRALPGSPDRDMLLCTDLHAGNVLAAQREPWLVVDPKPYLGDPAYDVLQHMLNCEARLRADPHAMVARLAGLLDLDAGHLSLWLFARCVIESADQPELADVARAIAP